MSTQATPTKNFFAGGVGGLCLVLAGYPFDTMKVRLQTMSKGNPTGGGAAFSGTLDCFQKTLKNEGIRGFYKGMATPIMTQAPRFALGFFGYSTAKKFITHEGQKGPLNPMQLFFAGAISGGVCTVIVTPVERIKCLLQVQLGQGKDSPVQYKGPVDCAVKLFRTGGISSLYRGFGATMLRAVPQAGLYYSTYDTLKKALAPKEKSAAVLSPWRTIVAGGLTGVINWIFILPIDVIKSRVQTAPEGMYPRGVRDVVKHLIKEEGPRGFYKGIVPVFLRAFPANAACFMGVELTMTFLNWAAPKM